MTNEPTENARKITALGRVEAQIAHPKEQA
jgi:hypothetical protein